MRAFLRKICVLVLAVSIALGTIPASTTFAADTGASSMKIDSYEGTVSVKNSKGALKSVKSGSRLFSGDTITTSSKSYAYVLLDSTKAVKIDENSQVKVEQKNKKLELTIVEGALLFDVSKPLKKNETLNIKTSNMVCGIRGTIGVVEASRKDSFVYILEGKVALTGKYLKKKDNFTVSAGEIAGVHTDTIKPTGTNMFNSHVESRKLVENDVEYWVAQTIKNNKKMTKRVKKATKLDWKKIFAKPPVIDEELEDELEEDDDEDSVWDGSQDLVLPVQFYNADHTRIDASDINVSISVEEFMIAVTSKDGNGKLEFIDGEYGEDVAAAIEDVTSSITVSNIVIEDDYPYTSAVIHIAAPKLNKLPSLKEWNAVGYEFDLGITFSSKYAEEAGVVWLEVKTYK